MIDRIRRRLDWTAYTVVMLCLIFITAGVAVHGLASDAHARKAALSAQVASKLPANAVLGLMQATAPPPSNVVVTPAPNPTVSTAVSGLLDILLKLVGLAATTIATVLLKRWLGGKVSANAQAEYSKLAIDAIGHAEELGHRAIKDNAAKLDSNTKLDAAVSYVLKGAEILNLEPRAEDAIKRLITAKLGGTRDVDDPPAASASATPAAPVNPPTGKVG